MGTLPAGTTEAQVDDMMMVLEVAGEATPTRSRPERHPNSNPSYIISALVTLYTHRVTDHHHLLSGVMGARLGTVIVMVLGVSSIRPPLRVGVMM